MTLNELFSETAALCFDTPGELDLSFAFTANRALLRAVTELSHTSHASFIATGLSAELIAEKYVHVPGASTVFKLSGAAYSFKACGNGKYRIQGGSSVREYSFAGKTCICRGFIPGECTVTFFGNSAFVLTDLASFDTVFTDSEAEIPTYGRMCEYKLSDYVPNVFRLCEPPRGEDGEIIPKSFASEDKITLPMEYRGNVYIKYRRLPRRITLDDKDREIDVEAPISYLLPLLCAAYVLLDTEEERAVYYMRIYEDEAARLRSSFSSDISADYTDVTGWA